MAAANFLLLYRKCLFELLVYFALAFELSDIIIVQLLYPVRPAPPPEG